MVWLERVGFGDGWRNTHTGSTACEFNLAPSEHITLLRKEGGFESPRHLTSKSQLISGFIHYMCSALLSPELAAGVVELSMVVTWGHLVVVPLLTRRHRFQAGALHKWLHPLPVVTQTLAASPRTLDCRVAEITMPD